MDLSKVVSQLRPDAANLRLRFGKIASVETDRTCTVTIAGSTTSVAGVSYLQGIAPKPGAVCVIATDGTDLFVVNHMAAGGMALAPRVHRTLDQTLTTGIVTNIVWEVAVDDDWGCWTSGANAHLLTAPISGKFIASLSLIFASNATGRRSIAITNGTNEIAGQTANAVSGGVHRMSVTTPAFTMSKGDSIYAWAFQSSGGNLALTRDSVFAPSLSLIHIG